MRAVANGGAARDTPNFRPAGGVRHPCCSMEDMVMDRFDFSPLFRSTIGFDRLARLVDTATRVDNTALSYPPYNIEKTGEDSYRLTMAVAGFAQDELDVTVHENTLVVTGKAQKDEENGRYLHRGIARRAFERRFSLADHLKVTGASIDNGLLHVDLVREVPEEAKPKQIKIGNGEPQRPQVIEQKAA
jgi:molecular chaperone IbpA